MTKIIETDAGNTYRVYHKSEAGSPEAHEDGPWFYEPAEWDEGEVYSPGFMTVDEAETACRNWDAEQASLEE